VNGVASFSGLTLDASGTGTTLVISGASLSPVTTNAIAVTANAATHLVLTDPPPSSVPAGVGLGLVFMAEDSFGNVDPNFNGVVTLALANNPGGATLGGTLNLSAVA